eukprot:gene29996-36231_t
MGSWWRSEEMTYVSLIVSEEAAAACIRELGVLGNVQFTDLNPDLTPFQRRYVSYIKRCDEIERKIRYINGEVKKLGVPVQPAGSVESFIDNFQNQESTSGAYVLESLESKLEGYEKQLLELNKYNTKLSDEFTRKVEYHHLLKKSRRFLGEANTIQRAETEVRAGMLDPSEGIALSPLTGDNERGGYQQADDMVFSNIAGTINSADKFRFERMLYRATRGNCYVRFAALSKRALDANGQHIDKVCFIIFYKSVTIEQKIKKICDAFSSNRYDLSNLSRPAELEAQQNQNQKELLESKSIIDKNTESRLRICVDVAASLEEWLWIV